MSDAQTWPAQSELVIGLVGPVGIDLGVVYREVAQALSVFRYECHDIHLTDQLRELDWDEELIESPADERIWSYMSAGNRLAHLREQIRKTRVHPTPPTPVHTAEELVARDEAEADTHGQDVRGIFHIGDFVADVRADFARELKRIFEILFGHPHRTPTRDEAGMFLAVAASRGRDRAR